ncbi:hypothetical protein STAS_29841 [Striga asiatica]|uniref:DUF868 family protein n=1 Tax=Striga asiatica TaxID=4170 RepID=A0A5A7R7Q8_STRAF|nr:hypothetical protein STAS_29841 [Striga asiatica]
MAYRVTSRSQSVSSSHQPALSQNTKTCQTSVTCVYQAHISGFWRKVTILWSKNLMNYSLTISIDHENLVYTSKIDLKPWHFWAKKGFKTLHLDGETHLDAYWDLRSAKFSTSGPEPTSDYYVALISEDDEIVLLLGDQKKKAYKRAKARPAIVDPLLFYKKEHVLGKKSFSTRARFDRRRRREHEIVVESSTSGPREPEMWISIDGIVLVHVKNLQWKFRGNQTVVVDKQAVQVYWDVHAWMFCPPGSNHGLFIFKSGEGEGESEEEEEEDGSSKGDESECSGNSKYYSIQSYAKCVNFCLFLYAWKIE